VLNSPWRRGPGVVVLFGVLVLVGCSNSKPVGSITGKVTYKGQPVTSGSINFIAPDRGIGADCKLDASGNYSIKELDAGTYKVYIQPPIPEQLEPGKVAKKEKFEVPTKYQDPQQTTISKEVKAGKNDIPVEIKD